MNRAQVNETATHVAAEERRRGAPDRRLSTDEVLQTPLQQRHTLLQRQMAERSRDLERSQETVQLLSAQLNLVEQRERKQVAAELQGYPTSKLITESRCVECSASTPDSSRSPPLSCRRWPAALTHCAFFTRLSSGQRVLFVLSGTSSRRA